MSKTDDVTAEFSQYVESGEAYITNTPETLRYFDHDDLSEDAQAVASAIYQVARFLDKSLDSGPEKSTAFRKLLECKDAAVRSALYETQD